MSNPDNEIDSGQRSFPFSAVVGQEDAKLALLLNAVDHRIGGVLLRGEKGSAKTTLARGLAGLLGPSSPFVELPVGATEDRLVGSLDITAALTTGRRTFEPGLLAAAHGGVLYVDEINLLPDHLVDVLLDVAASGVNRVEREGISSSHPARFVLIGSMNPEEGELRPQLLDRFGLAAEVRSPASAPERAEAVRRRLAWDSNRSGEETRWSGATDDLAARIRGLRKATLPDDLVEGIAAVCATLGAEGLRADLTICRGAAALATWEGRDAATIDDVARVAPLALSHRARRDPFDPVGLDPLRLDEALNGLRRTGAERPVSGQPDPGAKADTGTERDPQGGDEEGRAQPGSDSDGGSGEKRAHGDGVYDDRSGSEQIDPAEESVSPGGSEGSGLRSPPTSSGGLGGVASLNASAIRSRRDQHLAEANRGFVPGSLRGQRLPGPPDASSPGAPRGRRIGDGPFDRSRGEVALGATALRAARRRTSSPPGDGSAPLIEAADLRVGLREQKIGTLVVLAVDASGSMGAQQRMAIARAAVLSLLLDAYQRRDLVALVTFRGDGAEVVLRPTGSVEVAKKRLAEMPTGGRTPIGAGLACALGVILASGSGHRPLLVLITDGRSTSGPPGVDPVTFAETTAAEVRRRRVRSIVVDVEEVPRLGLGERLAAVMGARHVLGSALDAAILETVVRSEVG